MAIQHLENEPRGQREKVFAGVVTLFRKLTGNHINLTPVEQRAPKVTIIHIPREVRKERLSRVLGSSLAEGVEIKAEEAAKKRLAEFKAAAMSEYWRCHPRPY